MVRINAEISRFLRSLLICDIIDYLYIGKKEEIECRIRSEPK